MRGDGVPLRDDDGGDVCASNDALQSDVSTSDGGGVVSRIV